MQRIAAILIASVFALAGSTIGAISANAADVRAGSNDSGARGWGELSEDGLGFGITTDGEGDSAPTSNAGYSYQPPPECEGEALEELRTASDRKELKEARENLSGGCTGPLGVWDAAQGCFRSLLTPPFPKSDPVWEGNDDGVLLECLTPEVCSDAYVEGQGTSCATGPLYWAPSSPAGIVDPGALAQQAVRNMTIEAIDPGYEPSKGPGIVGIPTWYWVDEPSDQQYGPLEGSASAGGHTVTAEANVESVIWNLNGEATLTCDRGTPYDPSLGLEHSPDCGHVFETQGEKNITARSHWVATWDSGDLGYSGTIELDREATASFLIGEVQVLRQ